MLLITASNFLTNKSGRLDDLKALLEYGDRDVTLSEDPDRGGLREGYADETD